VSGAKDFEKKVIMLKRDQFRKWSDLPSPILTLYLTLGAPDASQHKTSQPFGGWLKNEARHTVDRLPSSEASLFRRQLDRVEDFLSARIPHEKSLVVFAGVEVWEIVPLQIEVTNSLHWGQPALSQLLWLLAQHKPSCIAVMDRDGVRFFGYQLGELSLLEETKFVVDVSQWKKKDIGHVARPGIQETYGSQRDDFEHRIDAQYAYLCGETAKQAACLFRDGHFNALLLVGAERLVGPVMAQLPVEIGHRARSIGKDLGQFEPHALLGHLKPAIEKWERDHEQSLVEDLVGTEHGAVIGLDETLAELQASKIRTLVIASDFDAPLHQCKSCGWVDASADSVCRACQGQRLAVTFRDMLPTFVRADVELKIVSTRASEAMQAIGGIGGWLRTPKRQFQSEAAAETSKRG
jgi:release factor family 10